MRRVDLEVFLLLLLFFTGDGFGTAGGDGDWAAFILCGDRDLCLTGDFPRSFTGDFVVFVVFVVFEERGALDGFGLVTVFLPRVVLRLAAAFGAGAFGVAEGAGFGRFDVSVGVVVAGFACWVVLLSWLRMSFTSAACRAWPDVKSPIRIRRS